MKENAYYVQSEVNGSIVGIGIPVLRCTCNLVQNLFRDRNQSPNAKHRSVKLMGYLKFSQKGGLDFSLKKGGVGKMEGLLFSPCVVGVSFAHLHNFY